MFIKKSIHIAMLSFAVLAAGLAPSASALESKPILSIELAGKWRWHVTSTQTVKDGKSISRCSTTVVACFISAATQDPSAGASIFP